MKFNKAIRSTILSLLVASNVFGQAVTQATTTPDGKSEDEKVEKRALEKKALALVDEILKEGANLRLPENRIRLQANAADLLWKHDEKRARDLFKQAMVAIGDLIEGMAASQSSRIANRTLDYSALVQGRGELRREILQMIAQHDPRLARDFLRGTRPSGQTGEANSEGNDQERRLALELALQIASTDPSQALQMAEESLDRGQLAEELPGIIQRLAAKDRDASNKLTADVMKKLRTVNLPSDYAACSIALALLRVATNPEDGDFGSGETRNGASRTQQILDDRTLGELVDMIATAALATVAVDRKSASSESQFSGLVFLSEIQTVMPAVEKYAPARAAALKKKFAEVGRNLDPSLTALLERREESDSAAPGSVDSLLEAAAKAPSEVSNILGAQAAMKALTEGDTEKARQIANDHVSNPAERDELLDEINEQALQRATEAGRLEEARQLLSDASVEHRVTVLTQFAVRASSKGDKKAAVQILEEARGLVGAQATNGAELNALLGVARAYVTLDPARSFEILEPVIDHANRLLAAAAVLDGFEFDGYFKDGELFQVQGQSPLISVVLQCAYDAGTLARADFERARGLADKFQAGDVRLNARLSVAQGILLDNRPGRVTAAVSGRDFKKMITYRRSAGDMFIRH